MKAPFEGGKVVPFKSSFPFSFNQADHSSRSTHFKNLVVGSYRSVVCVNIPKLSGAGSNPAKAGWKFWGVPKEST